jgi:hypothetical protein
MGVSNLKQTDNTPGNRRLTNIYIEKHYVRN